jgi:hypothetical protein
VLLYVIISRLDRIVKSDDAYEMPEDYHKRKTGRKTW